MGLERVACVVVLERSWKGGVVSGWVVGMGMGAGMDAYVHLRGDVADMVEEGVGGMERGGWWRAREGGVVVGVELVEVGVGV